jgi:hypothetical protein
MLISIQMERYVILQMSHEKLRYGGEVTFLQPLSLSLSLSCGVCVFFMCRWDSYAQGPELWLVLSLSYPRASMLLQYSLQCFASTRKSLSLSEVKTIAARDQIW